MSAESKVASGIDVYRSFYDDYIKQGKDPGTAERLALRAAADHMSGEEIRQVKSGTIPFRSAAEQEMYNSAYKMYRAEGKDEDTAMRMARTFAEH